ncbi:MAG: NlpC/P60 family protein, partial [Bacteroidota bacterium]|nr:NlpC/P60 family protein [Bacteroidota bacterium]
VYKWLGTPHVMGGKSRRGIDCSGFVIKVYEKIYSFRFKGGAGDILRKVKPVKKTELKEGDLLFFKKKGIIYHVGLYLSNNKFIHSASKYGVMVNDLTENYYRKYFYSAGRLGDYEPNITSDDNAELEEEIKAIPVIAGKISKAPNIEKKKGVIYKVQFGVYQSPLDTMDFMVSKIHGKIPEANFSCTRISDIKYKYYAGEFKTLREAQKINNKLKKCFKMNSFIVAFKNDKRISLKAAKKIKNY